MPWVILWRGGLGALDLVELEMLVVALLLREVVGGRIEVVALYDGGECVMIIVSCRWSKFTITTSDSACSLHATSI